MTRKHGLSGVVGSGGRQTSAVIRDLELEALRRLRNVEAHQGRAGVPKSVEQRLAAYPYDFFSYMLRKLNRFARHIGSKPHVIRLRQVVAALAQQVGHVRIFMGRASQPGELLAASATAARCRAPTNTSSTADGSQRSMSATVSTTDN